MKISSIEYVVLEGLHPFVFIHTDEGITGIGECFRRQPLVTKTVVEELLTPALLGKTQLTLKLDLEIWQQQVRLWK